MIQNEQVVILILVQYLAGLWTCHTTTYNIVLYTTSPQVGCCNAYDVSAKSRTLSIGSCASIQTFVKHYLNI